MAKPTINPVMPGFAPDPSCIRVDDTYYLVNSSFQWFPCLPIYTSKDLVTWTHVSNAVNKPGNLSFAKSFTRINPPDEWGEKMLASGGLYAPTIRYHEGIFYVVCTNVIHNREDTRLDVRQCFTVTSNDPFKDEWTDPVFFDFDGVDISPYWDDAGRSYIVGSAAPGPMTHIKLFEIDFPTGKKLTEEKLLWKGTGGVYPEGPHIFHRDGWYYLFISEGGCYENHMITGARSKQLWGPYEPYENNPLMTARGTNEYIRNIGHADMFTDPSGNWWLVCQGIRKDPQGRYLMGRETFLTPMTWEPNDWPVIHQPKMTPELPPTHHLPSNTTPSFTSSTPQLQYIYIHDPDLSAHQISPDGRTIALTPTKWDITDAADDAQPTSLAQRIRSFNGTSSTTLHRPGKTSPASSSGPPLKAGLALYKEEHRFARIYLASPPGGDTDAIVTEIVNAGKDISRGSAHAIPRRAAGDAGQDTDAAVVRFRISYTEEKIELAYALDDAEEWNVLDTADTLELTNLDFVGPVVGVFACGKEGDDDEKVVFKDFHVE